MIENPIPTSVRNWLYVIGLVFGYLATVATVVLTILGLTPWIAVLAAAASGYLALATTLARANLMTDPTDEGDAA